MLFAFHVLAALELCSPVFVSPDPWDSHGLDHGLPFGLCETHMLPNGSVSGKTAMTVMPLSAIPVPGVSRMSDAEFLSFSILLPVLRGFQAESRMTCVSHSIIV